MGKHRCLETVAHNSGRFQCRKEGGHEGNHWAIRNDGNDIVWAVRILKAPKQEGR